MIYLRCWEKKKAIKNILLIKSILQKRRNDTEVFRQAKREEFITVN